MFEKWRLQDHMEVADASGRHIGTVDSIDGDTIKLTRSDAADGVHHYLDVKWVDHIEEGRAYTKPGTPLAAATDFPAIDRTLAPEPDRSGQPDFETPDPMLARADPGGPLFGTSGHGTGMGGGVA